MNRLQVDPNRLGDRFRQRREDVIDRTPQIHLGGGQRSENPQQVGYLVDVAGPPNLGQALHALQDSFSPAHVRREPDEQGRLVVRELYEYTAQDPKQHGKGDETYKTSEAKESSYSGLGRATVLASTLLLAYFIQRCAGREADAAGLRRSLDDTYLREQAS